MLSRRTLRCCLVVCVFLLMVGDSSVARAGQFLNLPLALRQYFQSDQSINLDDYLFYYTPTTITTTITTAEQETFEISEYELVEIHKLSSVLAQAIALSPSTYHVELNISPKLLKLIRRLIHEGEGANLKLESYTQKELREMLSEAKRLECKPMVDKLTSFLPDRPNVQRKLSRSASEIVRNRATSSGMPPTSKSHSLTISSLRRATMSLERSPQIKTVKLPAYVKALWKFEEWFEDAEFQQVACYFYPWNMTDEQFANFINKLDLSENTASREIAIKLLSCFATEGFSNGSPKQALVDALFRISQQLDIEEFGSRQKSHWTTNLLERADEPEEAKKELEDAGSIEQEINWKDYSDIQIAQAWNFANSIRFRSLSPFGSEKGNPDLKRKLGPMGKAFDNYVKWILSEVTRVHEKADLELVNRFCRIATIMLLQANFHGAFTIFCALEGKDLLKDVDLSKKMTLQQAFDPEKNKAKLRQALRERREQEKDYIYEVTLYSSDFEPLMEECAKSNASEKKVAIVTSKFLKQIQQDQKAAASYQKGEHPELVAFFINLGHDA